MTGIPTLIQTIQIGQSKRAFFSFFPKPKYSANKHLNVLFIY